eukprot:SAG31_NODE_3671_length_4002_cov_3.065334_2_plen_326_part_00
MSTDALSAQLDGLLSLMDGSVTSADSSDDDFEGWLEEQFAETEDALGSPVSDSRALDEQSVAALRREGDRSSSSDADELFSPSPRDSGSEPPTPSPRTAQGMQAKNILAKPMGPIVAACDPHQLQLLLGGLLAHLSGDAMTDAELGTLVAVGQECECDLPPLFAHLRTFVDGAYGQSAENEQQVRQALGKKKADIFRETVGKLRPLQRERAQADLLSKTWATHDGDWVRIENSNSKGSWFNRWVKVADGMLKIYADPKQSYGGSTFGTLVGVVLHMYGQHLTTSHLFSCSQLGAPGSLLHTTIAKDSPHRCTACISDRHQQQPCS